MTGLQRAAQPRAAAPASGLSSAASMFDLGRAARPRAVSPASG